MILYKSRSPLKIRFFWVRNTETSIIPVLENIQILALALKLPLLTSKSIRLTSRDTWGEGLILYVWAPLGQQPGPP